MNDRTKRCLQLFKTAFILHNELSLEERNDIYLKLDELEREDEENRLRVKEDICKCEDRQLGFMKFQDKLYCLDCLCKKGDK